MQDVTHDSTSPQSAERPSEQDPSGEELREVEQERGTHVRRTGGDLFKQHEEAQSEQELSGEEKGTQETTEPRIFTVVRRADESGVSGTGRVLDGCIFHNGQVVVCWRGDINSEKSGYSSLAIYPCWEAFYNVHIGSHPENRTEVVFGHGADLMARLIDRAAESPPDGATQEEPDANEEVEEASA